MADLTSIFALLLVPLPAAVAFLGGRRLVARRDVATLPEELNAHRVRVLFLAIVASVLSGYLLETGWVVPVVLLGTMVAGFPARRRLYAESWGLGAWLLQTGRLVTALPGAALLLILAPFLVYELGASWWIGGLVLAPLLIAWQMRHLSVARAVLGGRPMASPVQERFARIVERSTASPPRVYRVGDPRGHLANAVAIITPAESGVLFGETLLSALDDDGVDAIFAHEVAHLEERKAMASLRSGLLIALVVALATLGLPAVLAMGDAGPLWALGACLLLGIGLVAVAVSRRHEELRCDLRAAELCGKPEALISALETIYRLNLIPRRLAPETERGSTHPALARRIQSIRQAAGLAAPETTAEFEGDAPNFPVILAGAVEGQYVALTDERVRRIEGAGAPEVLELDVLLEQASTTATQRYEELISLRLQPKRRATALVGVVQAGATWSVDLRDEAVGPAQHALDTIDSRLSSAALSRRAKTSRGAAWVARGLGALLALLSLLGGLPRSAVLILLIAAVRPTRAPMAACAAGLFAGGGLILAVPPGGAWGYWFEVHALILLLSGLVYALLLTQTAAEPDRSRTGLATSLVLLIAGIVWAVVPLLAGLEAGGSFALHAAFRQQPEASLLAMGAVGALAATPSPWRRTTVLVAALFLAGLPALVASRPFVRCCTADWLRIDDAPADIAVAQLEELGRRTLSDWPWRIRLDPNSDRLAVERWAPYDDETAWDDIEVANGGSGFTIGGLTPPFARAAGLDLAFLPDGEILVLRRHLEGDAELARLAVDEAGQLTELAVAPMLPDRDNLFLRLSGDAETWHVVGWHEGLADVLHLRGRVATLGDPADTYEMIAGSLPEPRPPGWSNRVLAGPGRDTTAVRMQQAWRDESGWSPFRRPWLGGHDLYRFRADPEEYQSWTTPYHLDCEGPLASDEAIVCAATDGVRTYLWTIVADVAEPVARCALPAGLDDLALAQGDEVTVLASGHVWIVDLAGGGCLAVELPLPQDCANIHAVAVSADRIALCGDCGGVPELRLYSRGSGGSP